MDSFTYGEPNNGYSLLLDVLNVNDIAKEKFYNFTRGKLLREVIIAKGRNAGLIRSSKPTYADIINVIRTLSNVERKNIEMMVNQKGGFKPSFYVWKEMYKARDYEIFQYVKTPINGTFCLLNDLGGNTSPMLEAKFPIDGSLHLLGRQYVRLCLSQPELLHPYVPDPEQPTRRVVFEYTHFPGIRIFNTETFLSDTNIVKTFDRDDKLKYMADSLDNNEYRIFMAQIGEELPRKALVRNCYYDLTNGNTADLVIKRKNGYQTRKEVQSSLYLTIPLLFFHNRRKTDRINMNSYSKRTLRLRMELCKTDDLVRAYEIDVEDPSFTPIQLPVKDLRIVNAELISKVYASDEYNYALTFYETPDFSVKYLCNEKFELGEFCDGETRIGPKGTVDHLAVAIRPCRFRNSFDDWWKLGIEAYDSTPHTMTVIKDNGMGGKTLNLMITSAVSAEPLPIVKKIDLVSAGKTLLGNSDPTLYNELAPRELSIGNSRFYPRNEFLFYFAFNEYINTVYSNGVLPVSALSEDLEIRYLLDNKLVGDGDNTNKLKEKFELILFYERWNTLYYSYESIGLRYA